MEEKRASGQLSKIEFLEWYIGHEENCYLNHEGSAQVLQSYTLIIKGIVKFIVNLSINPYV